MAGTSKLLPSYCCFPQRCECCERGLPAVTQGSDFLHLWHYPRPGALPGLLTERNYRFLPQTNPMSAFVVMLFWVLSNKQRDHVRFLTPSIKHHHTALLCHASTPTRLSAHKAEDVQLENQ